MFLDMPEDELMELVEGGLIPFAMFQDQILFLESDIEEYRDMHNVEQQINSARQPSCHIPALDRPFNGYVYILRYGIHFKIGKATSIRQRLTALGISMPEEPELIHVIKACNPDIGERLLHRKFWPKHVRGEWFALDQKDIEWLKSIDMLNFDRPFISV